MKQIIKSLIFTGCFCLFTSSTLAGSNQSSEIKHEPEQVVNFAKKLEKFAAKQQAYAFIISRVGQPDKDLPKGIQFTHTAIAVYSDIKLENGTTAKGYAIHNLYQNNDNKNKSSLVIDYPVDFFWGAESLKAGIIIPTEELQQRIVKALIAGNNKILHNSNYSLIANPFNNKYQNCTEHTLDIVNSAIYQTTNIEQLKLNSQAYFKPQKVHTSRFKLALGKMFIDGVRLNDHKGRPYTATFTSIAKYLQSNDLTKQAIVYKYDEINGESVTPLAAKS